MTLSAKIPKDDLDKRVVNSTQKDLRYYLMKWIEKKKTVTPEASGNWKVIPEGWWNKAKKRTARFFLDNHVEKLKFI